MTLEIHHSALAIIPANSRGHAMQSRFPDYARVHTPMTAVRWTIGSGGSMGGTVHDRYVIYRLHCVTNDYVEF